MGQAWDARAYDALPLPHEEWGRRTLSRLDPERVATVLDAGCGSGRDTALLLDLFPAARIVAVDNSTTMLDQLRLRLASRLDRVRVVCADLAEPLPVERTVDAITSVATFHWIADHGRLFHNLADVLLPGGQLVAECGGRGNIARIAAVIQEVHPDAVPTGNFAGTAETEVRLRAAGFTDVEVGLVPDSARFTTDHFRNYLETVVLRPHLAPLPVGDRAEFVRAVTARLPEPVVDYVRLTIRARKAS
ncbi:MAG: class I SAM-dependent methyltransferase [Candidatus Limnocylindria bacterium]